MGVRRCMRLQYEGEVVGLHDVLEHNSSFQTLSATQFNQKERFQELAHLQHKGKVVGLHDALKHLQSSLFCENSRNGAAFPML